MPEDPDCNPPPDGYEEGLESYLFQPLKKKWVKLLQESANAAGEPWFDYMSQWLIQPQPLLTDSEFPTTFVLTPTGTFTRHSMKQFAVELNLQFEYYCKHYKRNVTNELEYFAERVLYLLQLNQNVPFNTIDGQILCQTKLDLDAIDFDYYVDNKHIIRSCVIVARAYIPLLLVKPP